jgi:hypothetical protein
LSAVSPPAQRRRVAALARLLSGVAAARDGDLEAARGHLAASSRENDPTDGLQNWARHGLAAEISLATGEPAFAAASFEAGLPDPRLEFNVNDWVLFLLGAALPARDGVARAHAARGDLQGALDEYGRLLDPQASTRWTSVLEPRYVLARSILARRLGNPSLAAAESRRFQELWKGADAAIEAASVERSLLPTR